MKDLAKNHETMLIEASAIAWDVIRRRGYRTITDPDELLGLGFKHTKSHEIERALMTLLSQGRARRTFEETGGRSIERWTFRS